jgi:uncharacterized repeat protein (TIGR03803 family)
MAGTHFPSKSNPRFLSGLIGLRLVLLAPTLCLFVIAGQIAQAQTLAVLHTFTSENGDGATPYSGLIFDAEGNLYGTTKYGGFWDSGTVFELTPSGSEMELYPRTLCGNGLVGGLLRIKKNLYGTTYAGGSCFGQDDGSGSVFELVYSAKKKSYMGTTLFGFYGGLFGPEGERPEGTLIADEEGNVYGTTAYGGSTGYGLVYEITPGGTEIVLYTFCPDERDGCPDGGQPYGNLVRDGQGNLYGTTYYGGAYGLGTVFEVTPSGEETVLHSFGGEQDGGHPAAGLIRDVQGNFYGTTQGTVFEITPSGQDHIAGYPLLAAEDEYGLPVAVHFSREDLRRLTGHHVGDCPAVRDVPAHDLHDLRQAYQAAHQGEDAVRLQRLRRQPREIAVERDMLGRVRGIGDDRVQAAHLAEQFLHRAHAQVDALNVGTVDELRRLQLLLLLRLPDQPPRLRQFDVAGLDLRVDLRRFLLDLHQVGDVLPIGVRELRRLLHRLAFVAF